MIQVQNLSKYFDSCKALERISFDIKKGDVIGFLGPNGAGKTTLMRLLSGIIPPSSGHITINQLSYLSHSYEIKKSLGYLPEDNPLYSDMTVKEFLTFIAEIRRIPSFKRSQAISLAVDRCHLSSVYDSLIATCSKGFKQRVGIAQAVLHEPEILLLDEPTSGLDPNQMIEIRSLIKELSQSSTIIFSSHILSEIKATCDRVFILNKGEIIFNNTIDSLSSSESITVRLESTIPKTSLDSLITRNNLDISISDANTNSGICSYTLKASYDCRQDLFSIFKDTDWTIQELTKQTSDLESLFTELTNNEEL